METVGDVVTGTGPTGWPGVDLPIPDGATSVSIAFTCEGGGRFTAEFGDTMAEDLAAIPGECGAEQPLAWPVSERTAPTFSVHVDEGVVWTALPRFSTAEFERDAALTAECAAFTDVYSAFINADEGFTTYDAFGAEEWSARVETASAQLSGLAASATSSLAEPLAAMAATVTAESEPGTSLVGMDAALADIRTACDANQTPYFTQAEFGG